MKWLPAEPLLTFIANRGGMDEVIRYTPAHATRPQMPSHPDAGRVSRIVRRARSTGRISDVSADWLCIKVLRVNPCRIWGEVWWALDEGAA